MGTVLFLNAIARWCAPLSPILLPIKFSAVSVYLKRCRWWIEREMNSGLNGYCAAS